MKSSRFLISPLVCIAFLGACEPEEKPAKQAQEEDAGPAIKVNLPPTPNFDEGKVEEKIGEAYSLYGLRKDLDQNVKDGENGKEITVTGYVQEIYEPQPCPEGDVCAPPKRAHVWITDKPEQKGKKRAMMVVDYRFVIPEHEARVWKGQPVVTLEKGQRYTFKGRFKQFSSSGFADDRGLVEFIAYKPQDPETKQELDQWVFPPGADWHPIRVAQQQEEQAKLEKAAAKTRVKKGQ